MKINAQIIVTLFFPLYLSTVFFTKISLVGFWTDIIFSILLSITALFIVFKNIVRELWLRVINIFCSLIVFILLALNFANPFVSDTFKLRSFYFISVDGRLFNAYFKPVGAYAGGMGNFWISETPKYLPVIEWEVYWDRTVDYDFNEDNFDGEPIDNIVRNYIKYEVIDKENETPIQK